MQLPASLTNLSLRDNLLLEAPSSCMALPRLSGLDLRFNRIASLAPLAQCTVLQELLAGYNLLDVVEAAFLQNCASTLRGIDLAHNRIRTVQVGSFWRLCCFFLLISSPGFNVSANV